MALFVSGVQFVSMGLLGEIIARTYYESQNKPIYALREVKSHRKEMGDSAESARPSETPNAKVGRKFAVRQNRCSTNICILKHEGRWEAAVQI